MTPDDEMIDAFSNLKYLVIDEADRIINDESFMVELAKIMKYIPKKWTTYLFSATLTKDVSERKDLFEGEESKT